MIKYMRDWLWDSIIESDYLVENIPLLNRIKTKEKKPFMSPGDTPEIWIYPVSSELNGTPSKSILYSQTFIIRLSSLEEKYYDLKWEIDKSILINIINNPTDTYIQRVRHLGWSETIDTNDRGYKSNIGELTVIITIEYSRDKI